MYRKFPPFAVFLTLCCHFLGSCDKAEMDISPPLMDSTVQERIIPLPTPEGIQNFDLSVGRRDDALPLTHDRTWECSVYVPASASTDTLPLCIALHGGNEEPGAARRLMDNLVHPALKDQDMILLAPVGGIWWSEINEERVELLITYIKRYWPIDTQRIVVTGYSNGGTASTYFPQKYPSWFDAAIPMAGNFEGDNCLPIPTYFIHGTEDENYSATALNSKVANQIVKGCQVQIDLIDGYGHGGGPLVESSLRNAVLWLKNDVW